MNRFTLTFTLTLTFVLTCTLTRITAAESFVAFEQGQGLFPLVSDEGVSTLFTPTLTDEGIDMAVASLQKDILAVTGKEPAITHKQQKGSVIIGTIAQPIIRQSLLKAGVTLSELEGKREKYILTAYEDHLLIAGSDKRGAIYGVYELSRQIGVGPWYWFMDVPVRKHANLFIRPGVYTDGEPAVAYRGIFINDEWPSFGSWCMSHFGGVNSAMYQHIFELLLRLKGNFFWPAMWDSAFFDDDPNNGVLANKMGIVMSTSHHEPMNLAQQDWKRRGGTEAKWNYLTNAEGLRAFWRTGIERAKDWETITTVGMRGDGDMEMPSAEDNQALLEQIVADQRQIIEEVTHRPASETPQVWALYKEVQDYYDNGMQVPEDITLMLCDDNWGNVRRVPSPENRNRKGGFGLYYHFDYVGDPRNSKWINISPIPRVWEQLNLAYEHGIRQIWIANVGDLKPMEYPIQFFMDMAWNPHRFNATNLTQHTDSFCASVFGEEYALEASRLLRTYAKFNRRVTPEILDAHTFSFAYNEWDRVVADYNRLREDARRLEKRLPDSLQSAYFELLGMPIEGVSNLYNMYYAQAKGWPERVKECYDYDSLLTIRYHQLENGKWEHMMDEKRIGYTYWQTPDFRVMPKVDSVSSTPLDQQIFPIASHPYPLQSTVHRASCIVHQTSNGYASFEAEHFSRKQDGAEVEWTIIPELGRTLSGLTTQPVTAAVDGAWVEYDFTSTESDSARVIVRLAPTLNYIPEGQRLALRLDGEETVININGHYRGELGQWQQDHIIDIEASFACPAGQHTLRLTPLDNGIVMEKIMIDLGGLQPSFLGPEETIKQPITTWTCAPQWLNNIPPLAHQCLTQRVHVSVGGEGLALTLTNRFGESVLSFDSVFVDNQPMLFNGQQAVAIAAGQDLTSDWMPYPVQALDTLTITLYYNEVPATLTGHSGSRTTSYISTPLNSQFSTHNSKFIIHNSFPQWVSILNLQTSNPDAHLWAALGNSITDGRGSTTDAQNRWTDIASTSNIGFLNLGIGGNCVTGGGLGPTAVQRFESDILQQTGVEGVIIYIGVNDIGNAVDTDATLTSLKKHFTRFFALAHEHGLPVLVCTITPFEGHAYYTPEHEQLRQRFNAWLRTEALVEGVIDLDKVLADPAHPTAIPAALQDNDGLHPSALGHQKIGKTIANYILTMDNSHSSAMNSTIDELYNRMTLEERVAQLHGQHLGDYFHKNGKLNTAKCKRDLLHGAGHFSQFAVTHHATPDEMLHKVQVMQQWLQQHNRLYIPALFHEEVLSGVAAYGATVYPQQIGLACSFNPTLAEQKTFQTATDLRMIDGRLALSPMVDVIRDPSFNRLEESYGEDAYLSSAMGVAFVKGLQHGNLNEGVAACTKHYLGYGGGGLAPLKERMEDVLMPHEAIMHLANSQALMPAYHSVDGVKMIANRHWLTDIARDYLHFDGVVVSDYGAIEQNEAEPDIVHQAAAALKAGNDVDFPDGNAYKYLPQALEQGLITEADIERAVKAVLRLKYRLGLLDNRLQAATPLLPYTSTPIKWDRPEEQQTAYELATQSVVLLQNKGVLPLQPNQKIALVGPNANSMWAMLGDYTYHSMRYFWQRKEEDALHPVIHTLLEGMQQHLPEGSTLAYSRGCDWTETLETVIEEGGDERARYMRSIQGRMVKNDDPIDRQEALRLASESDVIIAAMGENVMLCGENRDRTSLRLPGSQEQFVRELIATGKPVVLVLFGGRAQVISAIAHDCAAVLQAWYPGEMGGLAVADLLYGKRVPSGKLSVTYPAVEMHEPICYNYGLLPSDERVAWPFGYGLSYTTFDYNHLTLPQEVKTNSEHFDLSVEVTNTGSVAADEIIQVYISPLDRSMKHKPIQLQGFARVTLQPNETKRVQWKLFTEQLGYWSPDGWCIDPGRFVIKVGASSQDIRLEQELQLTGPECTKPLREHYLSELITVYPL